jgi:WD40 repeat protein
MPGTAGAVSIWDLRAPQRIHKFTGLPDGSPVSGVGLGPGGKTLVITGQRGQVLLSDLSTDPPNSRSLHGLEGPASPETYDPFVNWGAISSDGKLVAASTSSGRLALWDAVSGKLLHPPMTVLPGDQPESIPATFAFSPDGSILAVPLADGSVALVDTAHWNKVRSIQAGSRGSWVLAAAFSPDGRLLATGDGGGVLRVWDVRTGTSVGKPMAGHSGDILTVSFSADGTMLASSGRDGTFLWDVASRQQLGSFVSGRHGFPAASGFTVTGDLVTMSGNGEAVVWPATAEAWAAHACRVAGRNLTHQEWTQFVLDRPYQTVCPGEI